MQADHCSSPQPSASDMSTMKFISWYSIMAHPLFVRRAYYHITLAFGWTSIRGTVFQSSTAILRYFCFIVKTTKTDELSAMFTGITMSYVKTAAPEASSLTTWQTRSPLQGLCLTLLFPAISYLSLCLYHFLALYCCNVTDLF